MIKWPTSLILTDVDGNALVMDETEESEDQGSLDQKLLIQPQLDEKSPEQEQLEQQGKTVENTGKFITAL